MNLIDIFRKFPDQESCIEHLESVRWHDEPHCPHCGSVHVSRKDDGGRIGRWNCYGCKSSFNVLSGTIFEKTRIELQKWFMAIGLIVNAKKSLSSCQLARDLESESENGVVHATAYTGGHGVKARATTSRHHRSRRNLCWRSPTQGQ